MLHCYGDLYWGQNIKGFLKKVIDLLWYGNCGHYVILFMMYSFWVFTGNGCFSTLHILNLFILRQQLSVTTCTRLNLGLTNWQWSWWWRRWENVLAGDKLKTCSMWHTGTGTRSIQRAEFSIMLDIFVCVMCPLSCPCLLVVCLP